MVMSTSTFAVAAALAGKTVRDKISERSLKYAWLYAPHDSKNDVEPIVSRWVEVCSSFFFTFPTAEFGTGWCAEKDKANQEYITQKTGKSFKESPRDNVDDYFAVVWTQVTGPLKRPFPDKILVIIGLEYLNADNGLPIIPGKAYLAHGDFAVLSGDDDLILSDKGGGGLCLLVVLRM